MVCKGHFCFLPQDCLCLKLRLRDPCTFIVITAGKAKASQPAILAALPKGVGIVFVILNLSKICKKKKRKEITTTLVL